MCIFCYGVRVTTWWCNSSHHTITLPSHVHRGDHITHWVLHTVSTYKVATDVHGSDKNNIQHRNVQTQQSGTSHDAIQQKTDRGNVQFSRGARWEMWMSCPVQEPACQRNSMYLAYLEFITFLEKSLTCYPHRIVCNQTSLALNSAGYVLLKLFVLFCVYYVVNWSMYIDVNCK